MLTEAQADAVINELALHRLAAAEIERAMATARSEAAILAAKARHASEVARWRDALRRNDLADVRSHLAPIAAARVSARGMMRWIR